MEMLTFREESHGEKCFARSVNWVLHGSREITDVLEQSRHRYVDAWKIEEQLSYRIILISNTDPLKDSANKYFLVKSYFH